MHPTFVFWTPNSEILANALAAEIYPALYGALG